MTDHSARAAQQFASVFARVGTNLQTMGVLGSIMRGDLPQAHGNLVRLPVEVVRELSAAASLLGSMADAELVRRDEG